MKKYLCFVLAFAFMLTTVPASAMGRLLEHEPEIIAEEELLLEEDDNRKLTLTSKDYANGDAAFCLSENGIILHETYVDRSSNEIFEIDYTSGKAVTETKHVEPAPQANAYSVNGYTYAGRIGYDQYSQGMVMARNYVDVSYTHSYNKDSAYNISGDYKTISALAGVISLGLNLSGVFASEIAKTVLMALDINGTSAFFVGDYYLEAERTEVSWKGVNPYNSSMNALLSGAYYRITHVGFFQNNTRTEGDYYPTNSFSSHNTRFANKMYASIFPTFDSFAVVSWT